jgi:hypothetical protein
MESSDKQKEQRDSEQQQRDHYASTDGAFDTAETLRSDSTRKSESQIEHRHQLSQIRTKLGLEAEAPIAEDQGHDVHEELTWSSIRIVFREPFAEFFGTFIMVLFGNGSVAQVLLSTGLEASPGGNGFGQYQSINWGYVFLISMLLNDTASPHSMSCYMISILTCAR